MGFAMGRPEASGGWRDRGLRHRGEGFAGRIAFAGHEDDSGETRSHEKARGDHEGRQDAPRQTGGRERAELDGVLRPLAHLSPIHFSIRGPHRHPEGGGVLVWMGRKECNLCERFRAA